MAAEPKADRRIIALDGRSYVKATSLYGTSDSIEIEACDGRGNRVFVVLTESLADLFVSQIMVAKHPYFRKYL